MTTDSRPDPPASEQTDHEDQAKLEALRAAVQAGIDSGVAAGDVLGRIRTRIQRRALNQSPLKSLVS